MAIILILFWKLHILFTFTLGTTENEYCAHECAKVESDKLDFCCHLLDNCTKATCWHMEGDVSDLKLAHDNCDTFLIKSIITHYKLESTRIASIPQGTFDGFSVLKDLDLGECRIRSATEAMFVPLPQLEKLIISMPPEELAFNVSYSDTWIQNTFKYLHLKQLILQTDSTDSLSLFSSIENATVTLKLSEDDLFWYSDNFFKYNVSYRVLRIHHVSYSSACITVIRKKLTDDIFLNIEASQYKKYDYFGSVNYRIFQIINREKSTNIHLHFGTIDIQQLPCRFSKTNDLKAFLDMTVYNYYKLYRYNHNMCDPVVYQEFYSPFRSSDNSSPYQLSISQTVSCAHMAVVTGTEKRPVIYMLSNKTSLINSSIVYFHLSNLHIGNIHEGDQGFYKLEYLNISSCQISYINPEFFNFPMLKYLFLSHNKLHMCRDNISTKGLCMGENSFAMLANLHTLSLSFNKLLHIPRNMFKYLTNLKKLDLSHNDLPYLLVLLPQTLQYLDLSNSRVSFLPSDYISFMDNINDSRNLSINLQGNPLQCACTTLEFIESINMHGSQYVGSNDYQCLLKNEIRRIDGINVEDLRTECENTLFRTLLGTIATLLILTLLLVVVGYHKRQAILWIIYKWRKQIRGYLKNLENIELQQEVMLKKYHAFVSHNHKQDYKWVQEKLLPKMEHEFGLKLCIGQRNFLCGAPIVENIVNAIENSNHTLIILTPAFLQSKWCDFELHMALTRGRQHVIIIYLEKVDIAVLKNVIKTLMKTVTYLEYDDSNVGEKLFWNRLYDVLTHADINV